MSTRDDFYTPRRGAMADTGAYAGFLVGFFGAAPFGWTALMASFEDQGDATMGVIRFAGTLIVGGLLAGGAGYALGALVGRLWERRHRAANPRVKPEAGPDMATLTAAPPDETVAAVARAWQRQARSGAAPSGDPGSAAGMEGVVMQGALLVTHADGAERRYGPGDRFVVEGQPKAMATEAGAETVIRFSKVALRLSDR